MNRAVKQPVGCTRHSLGPSASPADPGAKPPSATDLRKFIGRDVKNAADETIGEIESVFVRPDGTVDGVMVSVGGFLGMGEREVKVGWNDLKISQNDEKVTVDTTQDQPGRHAGYGQLRWCC